MSKVNLTSISNLDGNPASAATNINDNFATVQEQLDLFLSRDGEAPNTMEANLDMNSNRIINCADGILPSDAVTLRQLTDTALDGINFSGLSAGTALTGTEPVAILQAGNVVTTTTQSIANLTVVPVVPNFTAGQTVYTITVDVGATLYCGMPFTNGAPPTLSEEASSGAWEQSPSTSLLSALGQRRLTSSAAINQASLWRDAQQKSRVYARISGGTISGFEQSWTFRYSDARGDLKFFAGLYIPGASPIVIAGAPQPSAAANILGLGKDSGDANLQIMMNDGSGSATKTDTGATMTSISGKTLRFTMTVPAGGATMRVQLINLETSVALIDQTITLTSNIPAVDQALNAVLGINTGPTNGAAVDLAMHKFVISKFS